MAEASCTCKQCQIRRAAFGSASTFGGGIENESLEPGVMALAIIFGLAVAEADSQLASRAISLFVRTQNDARLIAQQAAGISSMEVAGHG